MYILSLLTKQYHCLRNRLRFCQTYNSSILFAVFRTIPDEKELILCWSWLDSNNLITIDNYSIFMRRYFDVHCVYIDNRQKHNSRHGSQTYSSMQIKETLNLTSDLRKQCKTRPVDV